MLYEFLLGDVASQRGNPELATQIYMDLANDTQDPRVARHAAQLAFDAHEMDKSVEALKLWLKLEPSSHQAKQLLTTVLLSGGKLDEARPYLVEMLAAYPDQAGHTFTQIYSLLMRYPDKDAALKLLHELAQPYPRIAEGTSSAGAGCHRGGKNLRSLWKRHAKHAPCAPNGKWLRCSRRNCCNRSHRNRRWRCCMNILRIIPMPQRRDCFTRACCWSKSNMRKRARNSSDCSACIRRAPNWHLQ